VDAAWLNARDIGKDRLLVFDYSVSDGTSGRGHLTLKPYKRLELNNPGLEVSTAVVGGALLVTLKAKRPALFVSLETDASGRFDDGGFDLMAGEARTIRFFADKGVNPQDVLNSLIVRDLYSATYPQKQEAGQPAAA
jgi:beta-mannosidase